jgi:DNA repair exonuclease SbcCD ATPase subunit
MQERIRPLKTIVGVRKRAQQRLEDELGHKKRALQGLEDALTTAQDEKKEREAQAQRGQDRLQVMLDKTFTPQSLIDMSYELERLQAKTTAALALVTQSEQAVQQQHGVIAQARRDVTRNAQRIDSFEQRISSIRAQIALVEDESADEQAEEASTTRLLRQRQTQGDDSHGT